jgi:hypothetical protein
MTAPDALVRDRRPVPAAGNEHARDEESGALATLAAGVRTLVAAMLVALAVPVAILLIALPFILVVWAVAWVVARLVGGSL